MLGWVPRTVLDVGGFKGWWTRDVLRKYPNAAVTIVEPNNHPELNTIGVPVYRELLSSDVKDVPWYSNMSTGDSIYKEPSRFYDGVVPVTRTTTTLDRLFPNQQFDYVKIDCQGAEIDILKGGEKLLQKTEVILLECPFAGFYNVGAPSFADYIQYVDSIGFAPFDMPERHYANGILFQIDIVFVRKTSPIWATVQAQIFK